MWCMMIGGVGLIIAAGVLYYKGKNTESNTANLVPNMEQNGKEKMAVSTIQLVPPRID